MPAGVVGRKRHQVTSFGEVANETHIARHEHPSLAADVLSVVVKLQISVYGSSSSMRSALAKHLLFGNLGVGRTPCAGPKSPPTWVDVRELIIERGGH
jgi:hypothetical protein